MKRLVLYGVGGGTPVLKVSHACRNLPGKSNFVSSKRVVNEISKNLARLDILSFSWRESGGP